MSQFVDITNFSSEFLDALTQLAEQSSRQRQHENIHQHYADPCQRLFNAIGIDSYIRPHRHSIDPKDECLIAVRGRMILARRNKFGAGVNLPAGAWHTVIAEAPGSILFEVKSGPFNPEQAKEYAAGPPAENTPEDSEYLMELKHRVSVII